MATNPVPSDDINDLQKNVIAEDKFVNDRTSEIFTDRTGVQRYTIHGMEKRHERMMIGQGQQFNSSIVDFQAQFREFLETSGYSGADRPYAAGIVLESHNEGFVRCEPDGSACLFYTPRGDTPLPYTTTGDWDSESDLFVVRGDDALRQDLENPNKGDALIVMRQNFYGAVPRTLKSKNSDLITLKDAGAKGDGSQDETQAFLAAAEFSRLTGSQVRITSGVYKVLGKIPLDATKFVCDAGVIIDATESQENGVFTARGSYGPEINTSENITRGDNVIKTEVPHGLEKDDWFLLFSQRACSHPDAGPSWQLGTTTANASHVYFAEPLQVLSVDSATQVTVTTAVIFPDYLTDNTQETYQGPRTRTTIKKINFSTFEFLGFPLIKAPLVYGQVLSESLLFNPKMEANFWFSEHPGGAIYSKHTYGAKYKGSAKRPTGWTPIEDHSRYNSWRDVSTWYSDWSLSEWNGSQCWDQSYSEFCGIQSKLRIRSYNPVEQGATTHGNVYGAQLDVEVYGHRNTGLTNRARFARIKLRAFGVPGRSTCHGLGLHEWGQQNLVAYIESTGHQHSVRFDKSATAVTDSPDVIDSEVSGVFNSPSLSCFAFVRRNLPGSIKPNNIRLHNLILNKVGRLLHPNATNWNGIHIDGVYGSAADLPPDGSASFVQLPVDSAFHTVKNFFVSGIKTSNFAYVPRMQTTGLSAAAKNQSVNFYWESINLPLFSGVYADGFNGVLSVNPLQDVINRGLFNRIVLASSNNTVSNRTITLGDIPGFAGIPVGAYIELFIVGSGLPIVSVADGNTLTGDLSNIAFGKTLRIVRTGSTAYYGQVF